MGRPDLQDDVLGPLRYDESHDWYNGELEIASVTVEFSLITDEDGRVERSLTRAKEVFAEFARYTNGARDYAVAELLPLKNENWLDEDEEPVTPEQFRSRMTLESMVFYPDGDVIFYHHDGDLFWGHWIEIKMNGRGEFNHADIPG